MKTKALIALACLALLSFSCGREPRQELLSLSFPDSILEKGERLAGFEITIVNGSVKAINNIPEDWSINLNADYQWNPKVSGFAHHGASELVDVSELKSLLTIRPWPKMGDFSVEATLKTTTDSETHASRLLKMPDLILTKVKGE